MNLFWCYIFQEENILTLPVHGLGILVESQESARHIGTIEYAIELTNKNIMLMHPCHSLRFHKHNLIDIEC